MMNFNLKLIFNKLFLTVALFGFVAQVNAALITWTGGGAANDWNDPLNWDSGTVPTATDDVVIDGGMVTLSTVFTAASLEVVGGGDLVIAASGVLNLGGDDGVDTNGALDLSSPSGTIINDGTINITNAAEDGIDSRGAAFINNGTINITGFGNDGLSIEDSSAGGSTFTNNGIINVVFAGGGDDGVQLDDGSMLVNSGTINVSSSDCTGDVGILLDDGSFLTNMATGVINVFDTVDEAIFIKEAHFDSDDDPMNRLESVLNNFGSITTSNTGQCSGSGNHGVEIGGTFNNNAGATYKDINSRGDGIRIEDAGTFTNAGTLVIQMDGTTSDGIENQNVFTSTGVLEIGCGSNANELEIRENVDLGTTCVNFDILAAGSGGTNYDRIENRQDLIISAAAAKLDFGTFVPEVDDCFEIVVGDGTVIGTFASVTISNPALAFEVDYSDPTRVKIRIIPAALPVELTTFEGRMQEATSILNWETASELNNKGFEIEHSTDGRTFAFVDFVLGNGTTQTVSEYSFIHKDPTAGDNYYRLKQIDFDGAFEYSDIVYLENTKNDAPGTIYPNPAVSEVTYEGAPATLSVYDALGQLVLQELAEVERTTLDISQLQTGVYFMEITTDSNEITVKRFMKQ